MSVEIATASESSVVLVKILNFIPESLLLISSEARVYCNTEVTF